MKTDLYTKIVLTVIAACLLGLVFRDAPVVTNAFAQANQTHVFIDGVADALPIRNEEDRQTGHKIPLEAYVWVEKGIPLPVKIQQ